MEPKFNLTPPSPSAELVLVHHQAALGISLTLHLFAVVVSALLLPLVQFARVWRKIPKTHYEDSKSLAVTTYGLVSIFFRVAITITFILTTVSGPRYEVFVDVSVKASLGATRI